MAVGLVLFTFFVECIMGYALYVMGEINTTIPTYIRKYLLSPLIINVAFIVIGYVVLRSSRISQKVKEYVISLIYVGVCFALFSVHSIFTSLYLIFTIPMLLTMIYGDYLLTTVTAISSTVLLTISEIFVKWDPDKTSIFESKLALSDFLISLFILLAFFAVCMIVIRFEREKNAASIQKELERYRLKQKLRIDDLTGIYNRTALRHAFQNMERDTAENTYILSMLDIDNFKMLNDTLGHTQGDVCLKEFGSILKVNCGDATPFRYGGDEFCILFKKHSLDSAIDICKKIQYAFRDVSVLSSVDFPVTISFGLAYFSRGMTPAQLLKNTDDALYRAKTIKNSISVFQE